MKKDNTEGVRFYKRWELQTINDILTSYSWTPHHTTPRHMCVPANRITTRHNITKYCSLPHPSAPYAIAKPTQKSIPLFYLFFRMTILKVHFWGIRFRDKTFGIYRPDSFTFSIHILKQNWNLRLTFYFLHTYILRRISDDNNWCEYNSVIPVALCWNDLWTIYETSHFKTRRSLYTYKDWR